MLFRKVRCLLKKYPADARITQLTTNNEPYPLINSSLRMSILNENPQPQPQKQETIFGLNGDSKTMFILGLAIGIGSMALLTLVAVIAFIMNGANFNLPKPSAAENNPPAQVGNNNNPEANAPQPSAPVPEVGKGDHIRGKADAKVTIIEYSDYQCPFCQRHETTMQQIAKDFPNDVRIVYRHFPLSSIHPFAQKAAEASECASAQGKFWEMHDQLFTLAATEAGLSIDGMKKIASDLKLDTGKFNNCLDKGEMAKVVDDMYQAGAAAGVSGTPASFINGKIVEGALPLDSFKQSLTAAGAKN